MKPHSLALAKISIIDMFSTLYPQIHQYDNPLNKLEHDGLNVTSGLELRPELGIKKSVASQTFKTASEADKIDIYIEEEYEERAAAATLLTKHVNGMGSTLSIWDDVDVCQHCGSLLRAR
jgi:hypothetical protein